MAPTERIEIRDGREFRVTVLPADKRLTPSASRKRAVFAALSPGQKRAYIEQRIAAAKRKKRRRRKQT